ncbi:MAG TPA: hypothetical protein PKH98_03365, partial [Candidatus Omnitrophota bacterium]|nr:hypothetical protein [Candidatus Omnitrophota bacterium]
IQEFKDGSYSLLHSDTGEVMQNVVYGAKDGFNGRGEMIAASHYANLKESTRSFNQYLGHFINAQKSNQAGAIQFAEALAMVKGFVGFSATVDGVREPLKWLRTNIYQVSPERTFDGLLQSANFKVSLLNVRNETPQQKAQALVRRLLQSSLEKNAADVFILDHNESNVRDYATKLLKKFYEGNSGYDIVQVGEGKGMVSRSQATKIIEANANKGIKTFVVLQVYDAWSIPHVEGKRAKMILGNASSMSNVLQASQRGIILKDPGNLKGRRMDMDFEWVVSQYDINIYKGERTGIEKLLAKNILEGSKVNHLLKKIAVRMEMDANKQGLYQMVKSDLIPTTKNEFRKGYTEYAQRIENQIDIDYMNAIGKDVVKRYSADGTGYYVVKADGFDSNGQVSSVKITTLYALSPEQGGSSKGILLNGGVYLSPNHSLDFNTRIVSVRNINDQNIQTFVPVKEYIPSVNGKAQMVAIQKVEGQENQYQSTQRINITDNFSVPVQKIFALNADGANVTRETISYQVDPSIKNLRNGFSLDQDRQGRSIIMHQETTLNGLGKPTVYMNAQTLQDVLNREAAIQNFIDISSYYILKNFNVKVPDSSLSDDQKQQYYSEQIFQMRQKANDDQKIIAFIDRLENFLKKDLKKGIASLNKEIKTTTIALEKARAQGSSVKEIENIEKKLSDLTSLKQRREATKILREIQDGVSVVVLKEKIVDSKTNTVVDKITAIDPLLEISQGAAHVSKANDWTVGINTFFSKYTPNVS